MALTLSLSNCTRYVETQAPELVTFRVDKSPYQKPLDIEYKVVER